MAETTRRKILHIRSNQTATSDINSGPKLPTADQLDYGEIAINYLKGKETISMKNSENEIVTFSNVEATYNTGVNTGASITSVPVNKRTVICSNITTTTQQTFALNGAMTAGRELHIVGKATVDAKIAFTEDSTHVCMTASPLEVATGKYFEINVLFANGVYYIRAIAQD